MCRVTKIIFVILSQITDLWQSITSSQITDVISPVSHLSQTFRTTNSWTVHAVDFVVVLHLVLNNTQLQAHTQLSSTVLAVPQYKYILAFCLEQPQELFMDSPTSSLAPIDEAASMRVPSDQRITALPSIINAPGEQVASTRTLPAPHIDVPADSADDSVGWCISTAPLGRLREVLQLRVHGVIMSFSFNGSATRSRLTAVLKDGS